MKIAGVCAALLLVLLPSQSHAQGVGFQAGVSIDPDQFYVGSHYETAPLVDRLHLRPGIEGGFGDDLTLAAINIEFLYKFPLQNSPWTIYQGTGPAIVIVRQHDESELEAGLSYVFGFAHNSGFFTELKVGGFSAPQLKFGVGFTVR
jgi:hypothetical protein